MILKDLERIKKQFSGLIHIASFYDDGTVFESTFEPPLNIPKIGESLSESIKYLEKLFELCQFEKEQYQNIIYETKNVQVVVLKSGEQSNVALLFRKGEDLPDISEIRRHLGKFEIIVDMDKLQLKKYTLEEQKKELAQLQQILQSKVEEIERIKSEITNYESKFTEINEIISSKRQSLEVQGLASEKIDELERESENYKTNLKDIESKKQALLSNIASLVEESKKLKDKISEKSTEISALEEEIRQKEMEKSE